MKIEIHDLLNSPEGSTVEFKSSFSKKVIQSLCAFANTNGGAVVIGVKDSGEIIGVDFNKESLQKWVNQIKQNTAPAIVADAYEFQIGEKKIAVLAVDEFPIKPVSVNGNYYKRVKNSNHQMSLTEVSNIHIKTFNSSWDFYPDPNHTLDDISLDKVNEFIAKVNKYRRVKITSNPLTILKKYELLRNENITNSAYLCFAKSDLFISCIECGRFSNKTIIKDSLTLRTDLFSEVEQVMNFILKHINKRYEFTGALQRNEVWDYPLKALREIIVNMVIHRDYTHHGDSSVKVYDNKIEFFNPGSFAAEIIPEKILQNDYNSDCRNKHISGLFKDSGDMEKYGTGIYRVCEEFNNYGLVFPLFENFQHGVKVTVLLQKVAHKQGKVAHKQGKVTHKQGKVTHKQEEVAHKTKEKILLLLANNPFLKREDLMTALSLSLSGVKKHLQELQKKGVLKREGSRKTGEWIVIKEDVL